MNLICVLLLAANFTLWCQSKHTGAVGKYTCGCFIGELSQMKNYRHLLLCAEARMHVWVELLWGLKGIVL